jgi:hypothetical protein
MCLFNQRSCPATVKCIYRASHPRFTMFPPYPNIRICLKAPVEVIISRVGNWKMELSYLHYPIKLRVRQDCVMRFKEVRFSEYKKAAFRKKEQATTEVQKVLIPIILNPSHTSKCICHNHSLLPWSPFLS